jgi:hypothetical protein
MGRKRAVVIPDDVTSALCLEDFDRPGPSRLDSAAKFKTCVFILDSVGSRFFAVAL